MGIFEKIRSRVSGPQGPKLGNDALERTLSEALKTGEGVGVVNMFEVGETGERKMLPADRARPLEGEELAAALKKLGERGDSSDGV